MTRKEFGFVILSLILFSMFYFRLPSVTRSFSFADESLFVQEYAFVDLNGDKYLDIVGFAPENEVTYFINGKDFHRRVLNLKLEHPRGFDRCDLNEDGIDELIIADHGEDSPPFQGGFSYILWGNKKGNFTFTKLSQKRAYSFAVSCYDREVYLSNSGRPELGSGVMYDFHGSKERQPHFSYTLAPMFGENSFNPNKFLAAMMSDINGDGKRDIILGREQNSINRDVIFWGATSTFNPRPVIFSKTERETWATVDIKSVKVNKSVVAIALARHNPEMSESVVEIWSKQDGHFILSHIFKPANDIKGDFWIPWVSVGDLNKDGRDDLSFAIWGSEQGFIGPRFYVYLNQPSGWHDVHQRYLTGIFSPISENDYWNRVEILDLNGDGKHELLFISFDGRGHIF